MIEYLKDHIGVILISGMLFVVGIILGLICKEDDNGIVFSANYPDNGGKIFAIGKTKTNISDIDLSTIGEVDTQVLIEKIRKLSVKDDISNKLREMVKVSEGPFAKIPVNINLHFVDDTQLSGPVAKACKNTPVFSNPVVAYELNSNSSDAYQMEGIMSLHAFWEHQRLSDCASINSDSYDVWVSKAHVETWLGPIDPLRTSILVKANIVVSSL